MYVCIYITRDFKFIYLKKSIIIIINLELITYNYIQIKQSLTRFKI